MDWWSRRLHYDGVWVAGDLVGRLIKGPTVGAAHSGSVAAEVLWGRPRTLEGPEGF